MNRQPIKILKLIIAAILTDNLYNKALIDRTWFKLVRTELYRRWKECAIKYSHYRLKYDMLNKEWHTSFNYIICEELNYQLHYYFNISQANLYAQIEIESAMLKLGMIVNEEERKMIEYDISVAKWSSDP